MDDLMQKLQGILNDRESMQQLSQLASMFSQGSGGQEESPAPDFSAFGQGQKPASPPPPSNDTGLDISKLMTLQKVFSQASKPDKNRDFLLALRPLLKEETQAKVDKLIAVFKILNLLPILKEMNLTGGDLLGII